MPPLEPPACPPCPQLVAVIKTGHHQTGRPRYRCPTGARYFTPQPQPQGVALALRTRAVQLYREGTSFRAIGRLLGVHHQAVATWIAATATP